MTGRDKKILEQQLSFLKYKIPNVTLGDWKNIQEIFYDICVKLQDEDYYKEEE